jgi:hypothetical protein
MRRSHATFTEQAACLAYQFSVGCTTGTSEFEFSIRTRNSGPWGFAGASLGPSWLSPRLSGAAPVGFPADSLHASC